MNRFQNDMKTIIYIQQCHKNHKVFVDSLTICNNDVEELFCEMDFSILIEFDVSMPDYHLAFNIDKFLPVHICRRTCTSTDSGTSGYKSIGCLLGKK